MADTFDQRDKEYKPYGASDPFKDSPFEDSTSPAMPEPPLSDALPTEPSLNNPAAWEAESGPSCCSSMGPTPAYDPYCACDETETYKDESSSMTSPSSPSPAAGNEHFVNPYAEVAETASELETEPAASQWQARTTPAERPQGFWSDLVESQATPTTGSSLDADAIADEDDDNDSVESDSEYRTRYTLIEARPGDWEAARSEAFEGESVPSWRDRVESAPVETTLGAAASAPETQSEAKPAETQKKAGRKTAAKKKTTAKKSAAKKKVKAKTTKKAKGKAPAKKAKRATAKKTTKVAAETGPEAPKPEGDATQPPTRQAA